MTEMGHDETNYREKYQIRSGKVRNIWDVGYHKLVMEHTNRISAFDRNIADVPMKGQVLNMTSKWWFDQTRHIIPNHMYEATQNVMLVEKCEVIPIEVVIRAYITGSTSTSLWTHYHRGEREYCGLSFPDGLVKNQKLDQVVITPTTKGVVDEPISAREIVRRRIVTEDEWNYITTKALELFDFGSRVADEVGYILVDTKLEFGRNRNGEIILIDEIFTCDSSRFWIKDTYEKRFVAGESPQSLDKDIIREYVRSLCDPYSEPIPVIPSNIIERVQNVYLDFYYKLTGLGNLDHHQDRLSNQVLESFAFNCLDQVQNPFVLVLSGSEKDQAHVTKIQEELTKLGIYSSWKVCSAHKQTTQLLNMLNHYMNQVNYQGRKLVIVAVAGMANALGAVAACNTTVPVISCPPLNYDNYMIDIHSSLRNPSNVPVSVIMNPGNCAQYIAQWFKMSGWM